MLVVKSSTQTIKHNRKTNNRLHQQFHFSHDDLLLSISLFSHVTLARAIFFCRFKNVMSRWSVVYLNSKPTANEYEDSGNVTPDRKVSQVMWQYLVEWYPFYSHLRLLLFALLHAYLLHYVMMPRVFKTWIKFSSIVFTIKT